MHTYKGKTSTLHYNGGFLDSDMIISVKESQATKREWSDEKYVEVRIDSNDIIDALSTELEIDIRNLIEEHKIK